MKLEIKIKLKKRRKLYRQKNKELLSQYKKQYREINKEEIIKKNKNYKTKNKTIINIKNKEYRKKNHIEALLLSYKHSDQKKKLEFDLDKNFIIDKLKKQDSKCAFCGIVLDLNYSNQNLNNISVDRVNTKIGHIKDNCNITCLFCNFARNDIKIKYYEDFIYSLKTNVVNDYELKKDKNIFGKIRARCLKNDQKKGLCNTLSTSDIRELYNRQDGKCAITKLPLMNVAEYKFPFKPSLDRIDNSQGHTKDNVQIVCIAINYGKNKYTNQDVLDHIEKIKKAV